MDATETKPLSVEDALAELREMFPHKKRIELGASFSVINSKEITCRVQVDNTLFMAATLTDCMAQVRKWRSENDRQTD